MKRSIIPILFTLFILTFLGQTGNAQNIEFTFDNAQNTNDGTDDFYEIDVLISADSGFKLGSGLLYFTYNTAAFGDNVHANSKITFTYDNGTYILGEHEKDVNFGDLYDSYITNDNTTSRVAFSWQQNYSSEVYSGNNVTSTAANLFHIKIKYTDVNEDPNFCFESGAAFDDQTYTACGSTSADPLTSADCTNFPGTQLTGDAFNCANATLPVELLHFTAETHNEDVLLTWSTANEIDNSHFEIERSFDGISFERIGKVTGAGTTTIQQAYELLDQQPSRGENYYRLRQVDFDGNFEYSHIEVVRFESSVTEAMNISVFPNPVFYTLNVKSNQTGVENIQIFNSLGQMIIEQSTSTSDYTHRINVESLTSGAYYIKVSGSNQMIKFIKK